MKKILLMIAGMILATPLLVSAQATQTTDQFAGAQTTCIDLQYNMSYRSRDAKTNGEVSDLQDFLNTNGYLSVEPTGYFGAATLVAVKKFQSAVLGATSVTPGYGGIGPKSRAKIKAMTCGGDTTQTVTGNHVSTPNAQTTTANQTPSKLSTTFTSSLSTIQSGGSAILSWSSPSADNVDLLRTTCTLGLTVLDVASGSMYPCGDIMSMFPKIGSKELKFSNNTPAPITVTMRLEVIRNGVGDGRDAKEITVTVQPATTITPTIDAFTASSAQVTAGQPVYLNWTTSNTDSNCEMNAVGDDGSGMRTAVKNNSNTNYYAYLPNISTTYTLSCGSGTNIVHKSIKVNVPLVTTTTPVTGALGTPTLNPAPASPASQSVVGGTQGLVVAQYHFPATLDPRDSATISDLKFTVSGTAVNPVTQICAFGVCAQVVNNVATLSGLNITTFNGGSDINVRASFSSVGVSGLVSNTTAILSLTYMKYSVNGVTTENSGINVPSNTFTIIEQQAQSNAGLRADYAVGDDPTGVAFDSVTNSVWVTNYISSTVSKVNINTGTKTDYLVGSNPGGIAFDPVTNSVWVANRHSDTVSKVNINTGTKTDYAVGSNPVGVAFDGVTNSVWVTNLFANTVSKVNINTGTKTDYAVGSGPGAITFDSTTNSVWVVSASANLVSKLNVNTGAKIEYKDLKSPYAIAFDPITKSVWVTNYTSALVSKVNIDTGTKVDYATGDTNSNPSAVVFDSITNSVWVTNVRSNTVSKISINTGTKTDYPVGLNPSGIAFDPVTNSVWVTNNSSKTVSRVNVK